MSGIIKSGNLAELAAVRALNTPPPASVVAMPQKDEERERLRRTITSLESDLRQRDAAIDKLREDVERALKDGEAKGHAAGLAEAQSREAERLERLEEGIRRARMTVVDGLGSLERLAALLARDCVEIVLGSAADRADFIARIVGAQVDKIDKSMLLGIEVARADFPDDATLAVLAEKLAPLSPLTVSLAANADLAEGGCVMVLKLGRMSVGIDQQWGTLRALLGDMALPQVSP